jgi:arabinofuranosyltransferase
MSTTRRNLVIIFIATVAVRLVFNILTRFTVDDAFITFRYAENMAMGHGFVYNEGQHVLGTSTPLFTLMLALFSLLSVSPIRAAMFISLVSSGITAMVIYRLALLLRFTHWSWVPALIYMLWPRTLVGDTCGMETAFFTMLVTASFYYQHRRLIFYALATATLAAVTRPEGLFLILVLLAYNGYRNRDKLLQYLSTPLFIIVPWLSFSYFYFGSVIPNSVSAKVALYSRFATKPFLESLVYLMAWHNPVGWILLLSAIGGGYWLYKKQNFGRLEIVWLVGMILFYAFSRTHIFFWYVLPVYPLYLLFAGALLPLLSDRVGLLAKQSRACGAAIAVVLVALAAVGNYRAADYYSTYQEHLENIHKAIGHYLYSHARADDLVAAEDVGYMGYYSKKRILDRDGLVSPEAIPYNRSGDYLDLILDYRPDWVVTAIPSYTADFMEDKRFLDDYSLDRAFKSGPVLEYRVYSRDVHNAPAEK